MSTRNEVAGTGGGGGSRGGSVVAVTPGKLYIAGEHAVVEPGHAAVLVAVDRFVTVGAVASAAESNFAELSAAEPSASAPGTGSVASAAFGPEPRRWHLDPAAGESPSSGAGPRLVPDDGRRDYVMSALAVAEELARDAGIDTAAVGLDLRIDSALDEEDGRKFGLGSSGAVTVATVDAATRAFGLVLTAQELFRSALLATIAVSPNASGGDIATSTYGGWVRYVSPDRAALSRQVAEHGSAWTVRSGDWGGCVVRQLGAPAGLRLLVGWTGAPASTNSLVSRVRRPDSAAAAEYVRFREANAAAVARLVAAWSSDPAAVSAAIREIRGQLVRLGEAADTELETPALRALCEAAEGYGGAAKLAGAGGGDCGIALLPEDADPGPLLAAWSEAGILPLDIAAAPESVHEDGRGASHEAGSEARPAPPENPDTPHTRQHDGMEAPGR